MFRLQSRHFLLVSTDQVLTAAEQLLPTLHVKLLAFDLLCFLDLLLKHLGIFVEATLTQIVSSLLHLDNRTREMKPWARDCTVLDGLAEVVELKLMLLLQFHLNESSFVFALREDNIIPFVLKFSDFGLVCIF